MKRSKSSVKVLTILVLIAVVLELISALSSSQAEESLSLRLAFDQPYYNSNQKFTAIITVKNSSNRKVSNSTVKLIIGEKLELDQKRSLPTEPPKKPSYAYSWSKTFKPGETQLKTSKTISSLKLTEGAYTAWAIIIKKNKTIAKKLSALAIVDSKAASPLAVALVWNLHDRAHFDSSGVFLDDKIQKDCFVNSHNAGVNYLYLSSLTTHPNLKVSMNFTPLLVQQISDISKGYRTKKDGKIIRIPKESKESQNAQQILSGFERLAKNEQIELIPAPFSYPSLDYLADQGWEDETVAQIEKGKDIIKKVLRVSKAPAGTYAPELRSTTRALAWLAKSGTKYTVLDDAYLKNLPETDGDLYRPHRVQDANGNKTTVFFSDSLASSILANSSDPEASVQLLLGVLAETYLKQPENQKVIVITPNEKVFQPNAELFETLYTRLEQAPWLKPTNLSIAMQLVSPDAKPIQLSTQTAKEPISKDAYSEELVKTKRILEQFKHMTPKTHPLETKLTSFLLIAEASDFLEQENSKQADLGWDFMRAIEKEVQAELNKIKMPIDQTITLTSNRGKIPIAIDNTTPYAFKTTITAESEGLTFPAGNSKTILLHPKENLFTFPVVTKTSAPQRIKITLHYQNYTIGTGYLIVKSMYYNVTVLIILALLVMAIGLPLAWRYIKSKQFI